MQARPRPGTSPGPNQGPAADRRGLPRRSITAALIGFPALWTGLAPAQAPAARRPTPAQTEGPYYPVTLPADSDNDLLRNGALQYDAGEASSVEGTVTDLAGKPLAGAVVEIWQCDQAGHYHHPGDGDRADRAFQGFGKVVADAQGQWRFRTIRPVPYSGRTPHIHLKVKLGPRELLTTQLYVQGAPGNARDFLWRSLSEEGRAALTRPFERVPGGGWKTRFDIVVSA